MIYLHPLFQVVMFGLGAYAFLMGTVRFRSLHLKQRTAFARKRHALFGLVALAGFYAGMIGGSILCDLLALDPYMGEGHEAGALVMAVLAGIGLASGLLLYWKPKARKALPLVHGISNTLALLMVAYQTFSGVQIIQRVLSR
ncbi:MAG: hypothetical protein AB1921_18670 [Thermodesulfobacteriota bacterium]